MNISWSRANIIPSQEKRRGKPVGTGYRHEPYFPEKVEIVRDMYLAGKSFNEIAEVLGMTRPGAHYIFKRWVKPGLPQDK